MPEQQNVNINTDQNDIPPQDPYDEIPPQDPFADDLEDNPFDDVPEEDLEPEPSVEPVSHAEPKPEPASQPEPEQKVQPAYENADNQPEPALSSEENHQKALAAARAAILEDAALQGVSSDMIAGDAGYNGTVVRPGRLTISAMEGSAEKSAADNGISFSGTTRKNFNAAAFHVDSLTNSEIEVAENAEPAYVVYKVDGIYNNHPFHLVIQQDIAHQKGNPLQTFFDDFDKAVSEGRGKDFLKDPALQFGFYDKTPVKSVDPKAFLGVMVMQAKLDMVDSLNRPNTNSMEPAVLKLADALSAHVNSMREKLAATDKPFELFSEPGLSNISKNYIPDSKEMNNLWDKAENSDRKITLNQKKFICQHMERLAPAYEKYFINLPNDKAENNLPFNIASDAIRGMVAREQLKNYLPKLDPRWKTMDTQEAEKLAADFKDKPTLQQKAFIERYVPEAEMEKLSFAKAKTTMLGAKVTGKLKKIASRFAEIKDNFTCGQVLDIIKGGMEKAIHNSKEIVGPAVARHVAKFKTDVKENISEYNMAQWQKDCMSVPPFEAQKAFVKWHELQDKVKEDTFSKNFPQNSCALYSKVISDYFANIGEKSKSPANDKQQAFLSAKNIEASDNLNYSEAHTRIADALYTDGVVDKQVAKYISRDLSIEIPDKYLSSVTEGKPLSAEDKKNLGQTLKDACIDREKLMRSYQIHNSLFTAPKTLKGIAQSVAANFYEENKTFDGADKEIAKVLTCVDFNAADSSVSLKARTHSIAKALGKSSDAVTKADIIADTMTRVLPQCINYQESMKKNLELAKNAQLGLDNEVKKTQLKQEVKSQSKQNFNKRQNGGMGDD